MPEFFSSFRVPGREQPSYSNDIGMEFRFVTRNPNVYTKIKAAGLSLRKKLRKDGCEISGIADG